MKRSALLISALALIGAACGSGDSTPTDAIEAPTTTATTPTIAPPSTTTTTTTSASIDTTTTAPASVSTTATTATTATPASPTQSTSTTSPATTTTQSTSTTSGTTTTTEDRAKTVDVSIENFRFAPASVEIHVGDIVRWTVNSGTHTTTSNTAVWDSTAMATGDVFTFTFGQAGSYPYYCAIHPGMQATITVEG